MKRALLGIGGMGLLVLAGCALAWHKWTQTPEYALRQIAKAVKERDRYLFDEYVDIDDIVTCTEVFARAARRYLEGSLR